MCLAIFSVCVIACSSEDPGAPDPVAAEPKELEWPCEVATGTAPPAFLTRTGCRADFDGLAAEPLDTSIPGAVSGKVILDLLDQDKLYFQNTNEFAIHYEFAKAHLNQPMDPRKAIGAISSFNPQYTLPAGERRFLLGSVTYYEQPNVWALEIAPYDTSTPEMIRKLYDAVKAQAYYGPVLSFHPTSESVQAEAAKIGAGFRIKTNDDLFAAIDYQPLNTGVAIGELKFVRSSELAERYVSARDVVVLDAVPNDISPVAGIITEEFQTPLSHINILARNRGTPNMGLRNATTSDKLKSLEGKQVRITVTAFDWNVEEVTLAQSEAWWAANKPAPVNLPPIDTSITEMRDIAQVTPHTDSPPYATLEDIKASTLAFGAKAANYAVFSTDPKVPNKRAFAIPVFYYDQFMRMHGIYDRVKALGQDPAFVGSAQVRETELAKIRADILKAEMHPDFGARLKEKLDKDYPGRSMRFRSSTNAEDLDGFPCAGCYDSHTGNPSEFGGDQLAAAFDAIRKTWATVWNLRTYEERALRSIEHTAVAMALLVHTNFPNEEANGVAITANIFDPSGNAPGFYVNVQRGGAAEVVHPPPGVSSDSFLYQYTFANQPTIYYTRSNLIPETERVLNDRQIHQLGVALDAIHKRFANAFQRDPNAWYGMDVEFKFDDEAAPGTEPTLFIKQARPYPPPSR